LVCIVVRLASSVPLTSKDCWMWLFDFVLISGVIARIVYFVFQPISQEAILDVSDQVTLILNTFPSFLFFTVYFIILFFWMEIFHFKRTDIRSLCPLFYVVNVIMYGVFALLCILYFIVDLDIAKQTVFIYDVVIFFLLGIGFFVYGILIYRKLQQDYARASKHYKQQYQAPKKKKAKTIVYKVLLLAILITIEFFLRAGYILWASVLDTQYLTLWWFDPFYWFVLECVPLLVMLGILHSSILTKIRKRLIRKDAKEPVQSSESDTCSATPLIDSERTSA